MATWPLYLQFWFPYLASGVTSLCVLSLSKEPKTWEIACATFWLNGFVGGGLSPIFAALLPLPASVDITKQEKTLGFAIAIGSGYLTPSAIKAIFTQRFGGSDGSSGN